MNMKNLKKNYRYIVFHKPYDVLSQFTSSLGDKTLNEYGLPPDIYPAGRLDKTSEGLLLLTNDGPFIKTFLDKHLRTYWVQVDGVPRPSDLKKLSSGVLLKTGWTQKCQVHFLGADHTIPERTPPVRFRKNIPTTWIEMKLLEGKNRQIRRMTAAAGYPTLRLIRIGLGKYEMECFDDLLPGQWREVSPRDLI